MQFTRVQSVFEWINDLCQLKFDPIFTTFFLTVRAFVIGYVWSQGPVKAKMTLSGPILDCFMPRPDFPHNRKFYFLVSVKRFFFIFVSTSLRVFLKRQVCQGWGFDMLLFVLYAIELQVHHTEKSRDRSMYHNYISKYYHDLLLWLFKWNRRSLFLPNLLEQTKEIRNRTLSVHNDRET